MTNRKYTTESVPTNTLKVGDIIICHGGLFRVFSVKASVSHDANGPGGECHVNHCEFIGDAFESHKCGIPASWCDGRPAEHGRPQYDNFWNEQGNGLARSCLVKGLTLVGSGKHAYIIEAFRGDQRVNLDITVEATNRTQAAARARKLGFEAGSVNMVG
jgi:hypothetical protein